ncbi:LysR substrate-binding domain-containing protein [Mesorhizobium xinjiangense]|uniref:LysR substrate-binding domain-containing protein n=1 Tax=Mesorhizobium xinjiangense TaxID=2678685 RepID=UPI0012ED8BE7|nr:LysR substrate-binding domain-containing protein [Mesorhizobium xinjiangense]
MRSLNRIHLNGLRAVEAVCRLGSLQAAAEELGVSVSAVSQQINRSERQLGRTLFDRTPKGLVATAFGAQFSARLTDGFRHIAHAVRLAETDSDDTLVVSVAPAFASKWLMPRLGRMFARHPDIIIRFDASTRVIDLDRSDVDLAIRMGDGMWPGVDAELLWDQEIFPVCAPSLATELKDIADLSRIAAITDENSMIRWEDWFEAAGVAPVELRRGASFTDPMLALDAVLDGHGVMLASELLAADGLSAGRLVAPFGIRAMSGLGYYLCRPAGAPRPRKVRAFTDWLREEMAATIRDFALSG